MTLARHKDWTLFALRVENFLRGKNEKIPFYKKNTRYLMCEVKKNYFRHVISSQAGNYN
jgi:hypothetical protein